MNPSASTFSEKHAPAAGPSATPETWGTHSPYVVSSGMEKDLLRLGSQLHAFLKACNDLYSLSASGRHPPWVADLLDQGYPGAWTAHSRSKVLRNSLPAAFQPELLLTGDRFSLTDLQLFPKEIARAAFLQTAQAELGAVPVGGARGLVNAFARLSEKRVLVSPASMDSDQAAWEWLADACGVAVYPLISEGFKRDQSLSSPLPRSLRWVSTSSFVSGEVPLRLQNAVLEGSWDITPPLKPLLEERAWFALLRLRGLRAYWRRALSDRHFEALQRILPEAWVLDPAPLPSQAEIVGLGIRGFLELEDLCNKGQNFAVRPSRPEGDTDDFPWSLCFEENVSFERFKSQITEALKIFRERPHVLQRVPRATALDGPSYCAASGADTVDRTVVRLRPYYFVADGAVQMAGLVAGVPTSQRNGVDWKWGPTVRALGDSQVAERV